MQTRMAKRKGPDSASVALSSTVDSVSDSSLANNRQSLSSTFKEKKLRLSDDKLTVFCQERAPIGYQSVCAEYSSSSGKWYYEVTIEDLPVDSHVRIGWSTRRTRFDQPIGSDCFSYSIRDTDCAKVSLGHRWPYGSSPLKQGDVIGCYVTLPSVPHSSTTFEDPLTFFPNLLCDPETVGDPEVLDETCTVEWSVNGHCLGTGFKCIVAGEYFASASIFGRAKLRFNFGPDFAHAQGEDFQAAAGMFVPKELLKPKRRPPNFIPRGLTSGA